MMKVYMTPTPSEAAMDTTNSINGIVLHLQKHLPRYGFELTENRSEADLTAVHAGQSDGTVGDVAHSHGLYPTSDRSITTDWHWAANGHVARNLIGAKAITVPSQWTADIIRRDMHVDPHVVGWAIDPDQWGTGEDERKGYVLWNKTRTDGVCTPEPLIRLAAMAPEQLFLTTFGEGTPNVRVTGRVVFETMRDMIRHAMVYLATTKETFGISTLEAMASGVPVLGFNWGGTADIVEHGATGFLCAPGDYDGLLEGLHYCIENRAVLGKNARLAAQRYTWDRVAEQFAEIYRGVLVRPSGPKISVVIPCFNYARYVGDAIRSVHAQQTEYQTEIIVVDDGSTDDSYGIAEDALLNGEGAQHPGYVIRQENAGVAAARNTGISAAKGEYIVCLDADDALGDVRFLDTLAKRLDENRYLGIVFTGLRFMDSDGNLGNMAGWPDGYNFDAQTAGHNQVPTCCMFRKEAWSRAGGYRRKYTPAEDAELWLRIGSLGYRAEQVTKEGWFLYRAHADSLSQEVRSGQKKEPDWRGDKPWIANGQRPFASDGHVRFSWAVRNYDHPKVSVVIPVGPYHRDHVREAIDSVESQTEMFWECIVVNDSGSPLDLRGMPYVRVLSTKGAQGAAIARNVGIRAAKAGLVAFLDADDVFDPRFLERTLMTYALTKKYVYTDWLSLSKAGFLEIHETPEFEVMDVFRRTSIHSINILIPKADLLRVGGFDETMGTWEDVELFMKLAAAGICGTRIAQPLVTYRYQSGQLRERGEEIKPELLALLRSRYGKFMTGEEIAVCCGQPPKGIAMNMDFSKSTGGEGMVRILYQGPAAGHDVIGLATKKKYGRRQANDIFYVFVEDHLMQPSVFVPLGEIEEMPETIIPPAPVEIKS